MLETVVERQENMVTVKIGIELGDDMMEMEEAILKVVNKGGMALTKAALLHLDTDGEPVESDGVTYRTKGKFHKQYQSAYGRFGVDRHLYQKSGGGKTLCPLEYRALIIENATPLFARQVSHKISRLPIREAQSDLLENHGRKTSTDYLRALSNAVGAIAQATEEEWDYHIPELDAPVATIAIALDGACMLMCQSLKQKNGKGDASEKGGWREAMVGSLSLYDKSGKRMHTIYIGAAPEYGKARFLKRLTREIGLLKELYPNASYIGIADGAKFNWDFLKVHTDTQILDFFHAASYLGAAAYALHPKSEVKRKQWLEGKCHALKHDRGAAEKLHARMVEISQTVKKRSKNTMEKLSDAVTYFANHKHQMDYPAYRKKNFPIGSGVIEAACKRLIKQRLCQSGMRWKKEGAAAILSLRSLVLTKSRWRQFWEKLKQNGLPATQNA